MEDKSLFFLTLFIVLVWLIIDNIVGKKYITRFLSMMFDFIPAPTT